MVFNGHLSVGGKNAMATGFLVGTAASAKGRGEDGYGRVCVAVLGNLEVLLGQAGRQRLFMLCEH